MYTCINTCIYIYIWLLATREMRGNCDLYISRQVFPYMRDVLHQVGEEYGFIALGLALNIEMDFTLATSYSTAQVCTPATPRCTYIYIYR